MSRTAVWALANDYVSAEVWGVGAALHNLEFRIGEDRFRPLAEAPWQGGLTARDGDCVPDHLRHLGGEWPCVPFGSTHHDVAHHGFGTDHEWVVVDRSETAITLTIEYPTESPVEALVRTVELAPDRPSVEVSLAVRVRRACRLPIAVHPIFDAPPAAAIEIDPGPFSVGSSIASEFAPPSSILVAGTALGEGSLAESIDGTSRDLWTITPSDTPSEELVQLFNTAGQVSVNYPDSGLSALLDWDPDHFPHCLFWFARPGLTEVTGSEFRGVGVEPTSSFFDRNDEAERRGSFVGMSTQPSFGTPLHPNEQWTTSYRLSGVRR